MSFLSLLLDTLWIAAANLPPSRRVAGAHSLSASGKTPSSSGPKNNLLVNFIVRPALIARG
jgi:hypothetical protein